MFRKRVSLELWQPRTLATQQTQINKYSKHRRAQASSPKTQTQANLNLITVITELI